MGWDAFAPRAPEGRRRLAFVFLFEEIPMLNVLLIDAYGPFRRALKDTLIAAYPSIRLREADSGPEGLRKASEETPHIICLDIHLPGEDGLDIATRLTGLCPMSSLIIITGSDLPEYRQAALQAGATHFVSKGDETLVDILKIVQGSMIPPQDEA